MLITLWAILLGFSFCLLVLGHFTNMMMSDVLVLIGYFLIFMLGGIMIFNGVYSYGGTTTTITETTYKYDDRLFEGHVVLTLSDEEKTESTSLVPYETGSGIIQYVDNARMIGLFILLIGAFGFITFWVDNRKYKQLKREEFDEVDYED